MVDAVIIYGYKSLGFQAIMEIIQKIMEKRKSPRFKQNIRVAYRSNEKDETMFSTGISCANQTYYGISEDISTYGIKVISNNRPFKQGERLKLAVHPEFEPGHACVVTLPCIEGEVRWASETLNGSGYRTRKKKVFEGGIFFNEIDKDSFSVWESFIDMQR